MRIDARAAIGIALLPTIAIAELNGFYLKSLHQFGATAFWLVDFLSYFVVPLLCLWLLYRFAGIRPSNYGLTLPPPLANELIFNSVLVASLLFLAFLIPERAAWAYAGYPAPHFSYSAVVPSGILHLPTVFYLSVTAGVVESIFYIGLPWLLWTKVFGSGAPRLIFSFLSSVVFAAAHWEQGPGGVTGALIFGLTACHFYFKFFDLWPIVGAHTAVDLVRFW